MKTPQYVLIPGLLLLAAGDPARSSEEELSKLVASITEEDCATRVGILASPEMQGRNTGSAGFDLAAEYVETTLAALGMEPAGADGSYRLPFTIPALVAGEDAQFGWVDEEGEVHAAEAGADFWPVPRSAEAGVSGPPLFVGYAIDAKNERWIDLPKGRAKGKVVFAFTREPRADNPKSRTFDGAEPTRYSTIQEKVKAAESAGAVALVLVPDPLGFPEVTGPVPGLLPLPMSRQSSRVPRPFNGSSIPVVSVSLRTAEAIFGEDLAKYQASIDKRHKPRHLKAHKKVQVDLSVRWKVEDIELYNIAARMRGSEGDGETLVLGAHLDHVGFNHMFDGGRMRVHPGADDNASGSATLLEVAESFAGLEPKDDVLFLWFTGEEVGLWGSYRYCEEPLAPHEDTIAMLNMDMVGRNEPRELNIGGLWEHPEWVKFLRAQAKRIRSPMKLDFESGRDLYSRSDQFEFFRKGVTGLFFFEGDLADNEVYHKPGDVPATIDSEKMALTGQVFAAAAYALAFEGERP